MRVETTKLPGVLVLWPDVHSDHRGWFTEVWQRDHYSALGIDGAFVQDNHSRSVRGVVRGLHWQRDRPQGKLVSVMNGAILDVVADLRPSSPTFKQHVAVAVEAGTGVQVWVPDCYAHGFCVTSDIADVLYKCTDVYDPGSARGLRFDDPELGIDWPVREAVLSAADAALPTLVNIDPAHLPR